MTKRIELCIALEVDDDVAADLDGDGLKVLAENMQCHIGKVVRLTRTYPVIPDIELVVEHQRGTHFGVGVYGKAIARMEEAYRRRSYHNTPPRPYYITADNVSDIGDGLKTIVEQQFHIMPRRWDWSHLRDTHLY